MSGTTKDAKGFVNGVVDYISRVGKSPSVPKAKTLLDKISAQARRERRAHIESAVTLTAEEQSELAHTLERATGHPVELELTVNPELIAGYKIRMADWVVDASFAGQLEQMKNMATNL
jgi:ATP synthase F1 delta subunit